MNLLALDTSTLHAALSLSLADGRVLVAPTDSASRHGRTLVPAIAALLRQGGLTTAGLDALAVGLGPGSYTGLRVGLMAIKTLAYVIGTPLVGLDSLEVVARNAPADVLTVSVVADAQRGDLYTANFTRTAPNAPLVRATPTRIVPAAHWRAALSPGTLVLGPALGRPGLVSLPLPVSGSIPTDDPGWNQPQGRQLAGLALDVWATGRRDDPQFLEPVYLRRSAAEDTRDDASKP